MRTLASLAFTILATLAAISAPAEEPTPLLKPVVPPNGSVRVRIPVAEERGTIMQFKAQIPRGKNKKAETIDVVVGLETLPGTAYVSAKNWQSWGYEIPANKIAVLPEMTVMGSQLAPKTTKGRDVQIRVPSIRMEIIEPPGGVDTVRGCDLYLTLNELTRQADRTFETRINFADKFLELTVPSGTVKRPGTGDEIPPEPTITKEPGLVTVTAPIANRGLPVFAYAAVNGLTQYKKSDGKFEPVSVGVSSTTDWPADGIMMTMGTARGCGVELEQGKDVTGMAATFQSTVAKGTVKELRLGFMTGPGLKTPKDLVLQDVTVWVDKTNSGHFVWLGPRFLETHFKDHVYACGADGAWQFVGRMKPDLLQDVKTRPKKP